MNVIKEREESLGILGARVPVDGAEIVVATLSLTSLNEALEPRDTLASGTTVGDSRCSDFSLTSERIHKLGVASGSLCGRHVRLRGIVRLVEAHESLGTIADSVLGSRRPAVGECSRVTPEHGNIADRRIQTLGAGCPVVTPSAALAGATKEVG